MKEQEIKDALIGICELLQIHAAQMLEVERRTLALIECLEQGSITRYYQKLNSPDSQKAELSQRGARGQQQLLDEIIQRLRA